jgi:hypothetical protein
VTLASGGTLSGTPTASGTFNFTVQATDSAGGAGPFSGTRAYTLTIAAAATTITVSPAGLPDGTVGSAYNQSITASGGTAPYSFAITAGALPAGVTLAAGGTLSGTPSAGGSFTFTVRATDSAGGVGPYSGTRSYTLTISAPSMTVSPVGLADGTVGTAYSQTISAGGGIAPYTFTVSAGALPNGLTLAANGTLSGTPTADGSFSFTVLATDGASGSGPYTATRSYTLTIADVAPTIAVGPVGLSDGTVGTAYSQSITASGGTAPYAFAVTAGALPAGVTLAANGTLSGTPSAGGSFTFTVRARLADGTVGSAYNQSISASGGIAPRTFSVSAGSLPGGLALAAGGTLSGTPTASGTFNFTVRATDSAGGGGPYNGTRAYTLTITAAAPTIIVSPVGLADGTVGTPYSESISASGGTAPYHYSVPVGALPAGVTLAANGALSGTPTASGTFNFTVRATDSAGGSGPYDGVRAYTLTIVAAAPTISVSPVGLADGTLGTAYAQSITASGGTAPYAFALTAGALPAGMTFAADGTISGTPTASGSFAFMVRATDSAGGAGPFNGTRAYTLTIVAAPPTITVSPVGLSDVTVGTVYNQSITASGGAAPYTFAVTAGALPAGTTLASDGTLNGSPAASGTFNFTVQATDSAGGAGPYSGTRGYTLTVTAAAPTIIVSPVGLADGTVGTTYNQPIIASGGTAPYTFAITAGTLPAGLTLAADGTLGGTPASVGTFTFTVRATDSAHTGGPFSGTRAFVLAVLAQSETPQHPEEPATPSPAPTPTPTPTPPPVVSDGQPTVVSVETSSDATIDLSSLVSGDFLEIRIVTPPAHGTLTLVTGALPASKAQGVAAKTAPAPRIAATYSPDEGYRGPDSFRFVAIGAGGTSAPGTVLLNVLGPRPSARSLHVSALAGQTLRVDLTAHATNGPFGDAAILSTSPTTSADVQLVREDDAGTRRFYARIVPHSTYQGEIAIVYTVTNDSGTSPPATLTIDVSARPDPASDPAIRALSDGQAETARRFASAQLANLAQRAQQLHAGRTDGSLAGVTAVAPHHEELNSALAGASTVGRSLIAESASQDDVSGPESGRSQRSRIDLWSAGAVVLGTRDATTQRTGSGVSTSGLTVGADLRLTNRLAVGAAAGYGRDRATIGSDTAVSRGEHWFGAFYGSARPRRSLFFDWAVGGGRLRFDSERTAADGARARGRRDGMTWAGSLATGLDRSSGGWRWSSHARLDYSSTYMQPYSETQAALFSVAFAARTVRSAAGIVGGRVERERRTGLGIARIGGRAEWRYELAGGGEQRLGYVDLGAPLSSIATSDWRRGVLQGSLNAGFDLRSGWRLSGDLGGQRTDAEQFWSIAAAASKSF